jgi:hypothetical protein
MRQMADFKSGARKDAARMNAIAKDVSDKVEAGGRWFAALKPAAWTKVTEADTVPKTIVGQGRMQFLAPAAPTDRQPDHHHRRIRTGRGIATRSPASRHASVGSIAKGKRWPKRAGQEDGRMHDLPRRQHAGARERAAARGSSPHHIARQLYSSRTKRRGAQLMTPSTADRRYPRDCGVSLAVAYRRSGHARSIGTRFPEVKMRRGAFVMLVIVPVLAAVLTALGGAAAQGRQDPRFAAVPSEKGG